MAGTVLDSLPNSGLHCERDCFWSKVPYCFWSLQWPWHFLVLALLSWSIVSPWSSQPSGLTLCSWWQILSLKAGVSFLDDFVLFAVLCSMSPSLLWFLLSESLPVSRVLLPSSTPQVLFSKCLESVSWRSCILLLIAASSFLFSLSVCVGLWFNKYYSWWSLKLFHDYVYFFGLFPFSSVHSLSYILLSIKIIY